MKFYLVIVMLALSALLFGCTSNETNTIPIAQNTQLISQPSTTPQPVKQVKEFAIESYTNIVDGQYFPKFSQNNITVNKGDTVRLLINVTSGRHDFKIDEFNVYTDTPTNQTTTVEFVAGQVGEFVYYCARPGHRQAGQWGTLYVID